MSMGSVGAWWFNVGYTPSTGAKRYEVWMTTGSQNVGTTTPYTFTDSPAHVVGAGKNYSVSVRAYDALTGGTYTQASNAFMSVQLNPLESPQSFAGTPGVTSVSLSWAKGNDNTRNAYTLKNTTLGRTLTPSGLAGSDSGLTPGTAYTFTVETVDPSGSRSAPVSLNVTTLTYSPPGGFTFSNVGYYSFTASWVPSTSPAGIIGYDVYLEYANGTPVENRPGAGSPASADFSGLSSGTSYRVRVRGYDAAGNRTAFSTSGPVTTGTPPPPPPTWTHSPGSDLL